MLTVLVRKSAGTPQWYGSLTMIKNYFCLCPSLIFQDSDSKGNNLSQYELEYSLIRFSEETRLMLIMFFH